MFILNPKRYRIFSVLLLSITSFLLSPILYQNLPWIINLVHKVEAVEIIIDATIFDATDEYGPSPSVVFIDSDIGYIFYIDATAQDLAYSKTLNGGTTWSTANVIDTTAIGWTSVAVWYDQWTPGDTTGTKIHIAASDDDSDDIFYTYLNTTDDSLRAAGVIMAVSGTTAITETTDGPPGITKGAGGDLFVSGNFTTTAGGKVSKSTNGGDNWTDISPTGWSTLRTDQIQLLPLLTDSDIIAIRADTANDDIDYQIYDEVADTWGGTWNTIGSLVDNATYDQWFSATLKKSTGDIFLTFANYTANAANDIEFWTYSNIDRDWSQGEDIFTDDATVMMPLPLMDIDNDNLYVAYLRGTLNSNVSVYYKELISGETSWTEELQVLSNPNTGDDYKALRGNFLSDKRLFLVYYDDDDNDLFGSTVVANGVSSASYIDTAIIDGTDEYNPSPSLAFLDNDVGYQFYVKNDTNLDATDEYGPSPSIVFTSATTGYSFSISTISQDLVYKKTIDGGLTWGGFIVINSSEIGWTSVAVWYDQWTPGDTTGTLIHIAASDDASDDIFYTNLNTTSDTLRSGGVITAVSGTGTITEAIDGPPGITKGAGGDLFVSGNFTTTAGGKVSKSTNGGDNWTDISPTGWSTLRTDQIQLLPLLTDSDIIAIRADTANDDIDYQIYDEVADTWGGTWNTIGSLVDNATYDQWFSATLKKSTGDIFLTFANYTANAANNIEFWTFNNTSRAWTAGTNVIAGNGTVLSPVPLVNESNGNLYVAYIRGTVGSSTRVYYKSSTDGGTTWSTESSSLGPILTDDYRYVRGSLLGTDNLYVVWYNDDTNTIRGNSLLSPFTYENSISGQSVVYRKTSNGGTTWGNPLSIAAANGTTSLAIWYDQWTPGDTTGTKIHVAFSDDTTDDYYYSSLDTSDDSFILPKAVLLGTAITEAQTGPPSITKGVGGDLFLTGQFTTTAGGQVAKSINNGVTWTDATPSGWSTNQADQIQLLPLLTGGDIIAIKAQIADHTIRYQVYDEATTDTWAGSWSNIGTLVDNTTYDQWFSASLRKSTGDIFLSFSNYIANAANDIEFWSFDDSSRGSGFTQKTNVLNDTLSAISPVPFINENNGDVYVAYLSGTLADQMSVYFKSSTDGGTTWSDQSPELNPGLQDDNKNIRGNLLSYNRLYVVWYNDDLNSLMGNTISTFTVVSNNPPSFTSFSNDGPKNPGTTITFSTVASDIDVENVKLVVCKTSGISGTACDGGGADTWCSSSLVASNPSCEHSINSVMPDTTYNAYPYIFDERNLASDSSTQATNVTFSINNVAPVVSTVTINGGAAINLAANTTQAVSLTATVTDNNSCDGGEIASILGYAYRSGIGYSGCDTLGEADSNNCYPEVSCSVVGGSCTGTTDASADYNCIANLQYYSDPTDDNTKFPTEYWMSSIKATDNNSATSTSEVSVGVKLNSLIAFNITTEVNYGSLSVGQSNDPLDRTTVITPTGNVGLDHEVYGPANMCTDFPICSGGTIPISYQKYSLVSSTSYTSASTLSTTSTEIETNVPKVTTGTPTTRSIWWGMLVPDGTSPGTYDGDISITGIKGETINW
ncbi:MAG: sialidase family protein [Candidatus Dojkabacteria bacterium]|jgi:hypothetical protein|nr:sialidase family protein [Candidatus Dojkabacteria bacterium]